MAEEIENGGVNIENNGGNLMSNKGFLAGLFAKNNINNGLSEAQLQKLVASIEASNDKIFTGQRLQTAELKQAFFKITGEIISEAYKAQTREITDLADFTGKTIGKQKELIAQKAKELFESMEGLKDDTEQLKADVENIKTNISELNAKLEEIRQTSASIEHKLDEATTIAANTKEAVDVGIEKLNDNIDDLAKEVRHISEKTGEKNGNKCKSPIKNAKKRTKSIVIMLAIGASIVVCGIIIGIIYENNPTPPASFQVTYVVDDKTLSDVEVAEYGLQCEYEVSPNKIVLESTDLKDGHHIIWKPNSIEANRKADIIVYGTVEAIVYNIKYTLNGGTNNNENPDTYTVEQTIILKAPQRPGYAFKEWKSANIIERGSMGEQTFIAIWTAEEYMVTLNQTDGSGGTASVPVTYEQPMPTAKEPSRDGYTFGGYYTGENGMGIQYYDAQMASIHNYDIVGDKKLYAKWTQMTTTISFNKNATAATGSMANAVFTYGQSAQLPLTYGESSRHATAIGFANFHYLFVGWAESATGAVVYTNGQTINTWTKTETSITLYAKWQLSYVYKDNYTKKTITHLGLYGLQCTQYDTIDLSPLSSFRTSSYYFRIVLYINVAEVNDGYQEVYLYNNSTIVANSTSYTWDYAVAHFGMIDGQMFEHGSGYKDNTSWTHAIIFEIDGNKMPSGLLYIRYDAYGEDDDTWYRNSIQINVAAYAKR
ncbi:MAG: InlB B-repeat-containing protein [Clostridiales bacterium]|jgi:uncharacterized repeat protein (TIGR02543 family)|nr:InlB B-repeat-containing protein [Clostridiales bacterium]